MARSTENENITPLQAELDSAISLISRTPQKCQIDHGRREARDWIGVRPSSAAATCAVRRPWGKLRTRQLLCSAEVAAPEGGRTPLIPPCPRGEAYAAAVVLIPFSTRHRALRRGVATPAFCARRHGSRNNASISSG